MLLQTVRLALAIVSKIADAYVRFVADRKFDSQRMSYLRNGNGCKYYVIIVVSIIEQLII